MKKLRYVISNYVIWLWLIILPESRYKRELVGVIYDLRQKVIDAVLGIPENGMMSKEEFVSRRTNIISKMLDNPDEYGIYPTTQCFAELDDLFDDLMNYKRGPSWAQIDRDAKIKVAMSVDVGI